MQALGGLFEASVGGASTVYRFARHDLEFYPDGTETSAILYF